MKYPSKFSLCVHTRNDSVSAVAELISTTIPECTNKEYIMSELEKNGQIKVGTFYNDIARSKRFKLMQAANRKELFNVTVTIKELEE